MTNNITEKALHVTWGVLCVILLAGGGFVVRQVWADGNEIATNKATVGAHVAEDDRQWRSLQEQLDRRFESLQAQLDRIEKKVDLK